jgi:hypothetical protein
MSIEYSDPFLSSHLHIYKTQDPVFLVRQKELRDMYCRGIGSLNSIMEEMYTLGKEQRLILLREEKGSTYIENL